MKKTMLVAVLAIFVGATAADAGYYRTKNFDGTYTSTGRTNDMGTGRAPAGYHTNEFGHVERNGL